MDDERIKEEGEGYFVIMKDECIEHKKPTTTSGRKV